MNLNAVLALDTSTEQCSVALKVGDTLVTRAAVTPREHSQRILGFVQEVLDEQNITLADLDALVVGNGPGSFTGVRIGVSVAQGLAFSHTLPVIPVSTLTALAQQAIRQHDAKAVISAIDARMQEIYVAPFRNNNGMAEQLSPEQMAPLSDITELAWWSDVAATDAVKGAGTGWEAYGEALNPNQQVTVLEAVTLPLAEDMLRWALVNGKAVEAADLEPLYVRNEVAWKKLPGRE
ncbi:tRNA (adenosine(37)-N6)-threonylcarbamoyltransferase complex dimerization subunit type 1 TsaB [Pseudidiomarina andamanensis]|uniref:tRNA (adenosine(37)-N6)-threonylcarbamoyltransferase complex dimerization subunit type 1 TsaB n=1 Tax=Pseudidiomarina andamanensis TaxID=1940690 RepID=UPI002876F9E1|nr:tRNA (adenosine(37)-N6)-threonylcarbamoyltransferase complex dimerization subunit type 1 TsaB [Pseudidiomarina andamanensis]MDS0218060.1 tRNA (adenosine(37)-N6)-threonylcarbamoyltransferase complex dimerization subunit type 1 TsaB [Pseudidiomarina andamanensis]